MNRLSITARKDLKALKRKVEANGLPISELTEQLHKWVNLYEQHENGVRELRDWYNEARSRSGINLRKINKEFLQQKELLDETKHYMLKSAKYSFQLNEDELRSVGIKLTSPSIQ